MQIVLIFEKGNGDQGRAPGQGKGHHHYRTEQQWLRGRRRFWRGHGRRRIGRRWRRRRRQLQTTTVGGVIRRQPGRRLGHRRAPSSNATATAAVPSHLGRHRSSRRRSATAAGPARVPDGAQLDVQPQLHVHEPLSARLQHGPSIADRNSASPAITTATGQCFFIFYFLFHFVHPAPKLFRLTPTMDPTNV